MKDHMTQRRRAERDRKPRVAWRVAVVLMMAGPWFAAATLAADDSPERLRVITETDAGGDPDDEQSLVRFLLYTNEWDVEGIIANRPRARDGENKNRQRTGLGIVRAMVAAYGRSWPNLVKHDPRYPSPDELAAHTVAGYDDTEDAVKLITAAVDRDDRRPVWYCDWGTDHGAAVNNLRRVLDRVLAERGTDGYAKFKSRLRLSSADAFGRHTRRACAAICIVGRHVSPTASRASGGITASRRSWPGPAGSTSSATCAATTVRSARCIR